ncbi:MAG: hypothetical protein ACOYUK_05590 [Patescibacteria group bacterium]
MFLNAPVNPTPVKRRLYLAVSVLLGLLLSVLLHVVIEQLFLSWTTDAGHAVTWYGGCALHPALQIGLLVLGALGGYGLGRMWWRMVYIDRRWAKGIIKKYSQSNEPTASTHQQ